MPEPRKQNTPSLEKPLSAFPLQPACRTVLSASPLRFSLPPHRRPPAPARSSAVPASPPAAPVLAATNRKRVPSVHAHGNSRGQTFRRPAAASHASARMIPSASVPSLPRRAPYLPPFKGSMLTDGGYGLKMCFTGRLLLIHLPSLNPVNHSQESDPKKEPGGATRLRSRRPV